MKGREARLVFSTMNASFGWIQIQKVVTRGVVEGCPLTIERGEIPAMAIDWLPNISWPLYCLQ